MNIEQLFLDFSIPYVTEGHKHSRSGWVNVECPFCTGNPGFHLGFEINTKKVVCWRCGGKNIKTAISSLLNVSFKEVGVILQKYNLDSSIPMKMDKKVVIKPFLYPKNTTPLQNNHKQYLISRGFNPEKLERKYQLVGTSVHSPLDKIQYNHRILIPYRWGSENEIVSFDSRDITNKSTSKYLACPENREKTPHKNILYGCPNKWKSTGICVEGSTDVWRFGDDSFATSGIKYTSTQIHWMVKLFKRIFICFDNDGKNTQSIEQANKLTAELKFRGVQAFKITLENGDPASMSQDDADYFVKNLITKWI